MSRICRKTTTTFVKRFLRCVYSSKRSFRELTAHLPGWLPDTRDLRSTLSLRAMPGITVLFLRTVAEIQVRDASDPNVAEFQLREAARLAQQRVAGIRVPGTDAANQTDQVQGCCECCRNGFNNTMSFLIRGAHRLKLCTAYLKKYHISIPKLAFPKTKSERPITSFHHAARTRTYVLA